jgi:hypothetical protein
VLRLRCREALIPVVPQVEVYRAGILIGRLDLANEELMLGAEYDGPEWHSSPDQLAHDRARRREFRDEGWLVKAFGKDAVFGRDRECDAVLHEAAREARRRRGRRVVE